MHAAVLLLLKVGEGMGLVEELLGCSLLDITRPYWAVKLSTGTWVCEAHTKTDLRTGSVRYFDWSNDLVASGDVLKIAQLWLLCPSSKRSPLGNTAWLQITESGTAFQFKVSTVDSIVVESVRSLQAHIIGKVTNKETGDCEVFIWDTYQQGLITPTTRIYDSLTNSYRKDSNGNPVYAGKANVYNFHSWREGIAPLGRLELSTVGVRI